MKQKILFICLGNICRSPAAEGVFRALVEQRDKTDLFEIDSAGIGSWHAGQLPDVRMRRTGAKRGYNFDSRARQITQQDFRDFDAIYAMDEENVYDLQRLAPAGTAQKIHRLSDFIQTRNATTIPDPYYGDERDFEYALDLIEEACENLLDSLLKATK